MAQQTVVNNQNVTSVAATDTELILTQPFDRWDLSTILVRIELVSGTVRFGIGDASPTSLRSYSTAGDRAIFACQNDVAAFRLHCYGAGVFTITW